MKKNLLFVFSLLSLLGFMFGLDDYSDYGYIEDLFPIWGYFSVPLIIQLIWLRIFISDSE